MTRFFPIFTALLTAGSSAFAYTNILDSGDQQIVTNAWDISGQTMIIGDTTLTNRLVVIDGGHITNAVGLIGNASGADSNGVYVSGSDASWVMSGDLTVGNAGSDNVLDINRGGTLSNSNAFLGATSGSSNNMVSVTGAGSRWDNAGQISLGDGGSNLVEVASGGTITASGLVISTNGSGFFVNDGGSFILDNSLNAGMKGFNWNAGGNLALTGDLTGMDVTNNAVILNDSRDLTLDGGSWANGSNDLIVGFNSSGSTLSVTNGATVENVNGFIGWGDDSYGNLVQVTDAGSEWRNNGNLYLGTYGEATNLLAAGMDNALVVSNNAWVYAGEATTNDIAVVSSGGILVASTNGAILIADNSSTVETSGILYIGGTNGVLTGTVTVTNGSSIKAAGLIIESGGTFNLNRGGTNFITGDLNQDTITGLNWNDGATLAVGGTYTKDDGVLNGTDRSLLISGTNANWSPTATLSVTGTSNTFYVADGGVVTSSNALVGVAGSDSNNTAWVYGENSSWIINGELTIGATNNAGNQVIVSDGGLIEVNALNVSTNNSFNLNHGGTLAVNGAFDIEANPLLNWNSGGNLSVAGTLSGMDSVSNEAGTAVILDGEHDLTLNGGNWLNGNTNLIIGYHATSSSLAVTNGATLSSADGYIGWGDAAYGNSVLVSGSGSVWTNSGAMHVGVYGTNLTSTGNNGSTANNNVLMVKDGAWVYVGDATTNDLSAATAGGMLVSSSATNGAQLILGSGTVNVEETLYLGINSNNSATATIRNTGILAVGDLEIAENSSLDLQSGGTFAIDADFDIQNWLTNGFNWGEGSELTVGGSLTSMTTTNIGGFDYAFLGGSRDLTLDGSNAVWNAVGENLIVGLDGAGSTLTLLNGATMTNATTHIGWSTNSTGSDIVLDTGSTWDNTGDVWVGYGSSANGLFVRGGSTNAMGGNAYIGNTNTSGNVVEVSGSNSVWDVIGDVIVGSSSGGTQNSLQVYDAAVVNIGSDLTIHSSNGVDVANGGSITLGGNLNIFSNSTVIGDGIIEFTDATAVLSLTGENILLDNTLVFQGAGSNTLLLTDGTFLLDGTVSNQYLDFQTLDLSDSGLEGYGTLESSTFADVTLTGGTINPYSIGSAFGTLEIGGALTLNGGTLYTAQVNNVSHDLLIISDPNAVDLSMLDLGVFVPSMQIGTNINILVATNGAGFAGSSFGSTNIVDRMLLADSRVEINDLGVVSIITEANNTKFSSALAYAGSEGIRAGFNGMKNSVFTRTKQLRRNLVSTAHSIPHEAFLLSNTNAPAGAMGPGDQNTILDMHIWMQYFSGQGTFDAQGDSYGFNLNNNGMTIGADRLLGEALTVGFNYTYARADGRTTNNDTIETETYYIGAYGEWVGKSGLYIDALVAYGASDYESVRLEDNYRGTAKYRGNDVGAYADMGQYYYYKNFSISPYIGLHTLFVMAENHTETDEIGGSKVLVEESTRTWIESALGLKARHRFDTRMGRFQTTGFAEWTHDFKQDEIASTLSSGNIGPLSMAEISPDSDTLNAGAGLSWICTDYLEVGIGYNGRFSNRYEEHTGSIMFDIRF